MGRNYVTGIAPSTSTLSPSTEPVASSDSRTASTRSTAARTPTDGPEPESHAANAPAPVAASPLPPRSGQSLEPGLVESVADCLGEEMRIVLVQRGHQSAVWPML